MDELKKDGEGALEPALFPVEQRWQASLPLTAALLLLWAVFVCFALEAYFAAGRMPVLPFEPWYEHGHEIFPPVLETPFALLMRHAGQYLKLLFFVVTCWGVGRTVLRRALKLKRMLALESVVFSFGLGLGVMGGLVFVLGACGLLHAALLRVLAVVVCVVCLVVNRDAAGSIRALAHEGKQIFSLAGPWSYVFCLALAAVFFCSGFFALAPEIFYDSLVYHLALPSQYLMAGRLHATPTNLYSGIPMYMEMLYTWGLVIGDGALARLIHWSTGIGVWVAVMALSLRCRAPLFGWLASAMFFFMPMTIYNMGTTAVEVGSTFMVVLCVYACLLFLAGEADGENGATGFCILSAIFCGVAMGMKYPNWPIAGVMVLALLLTRTQKRSWMVFGGIAAVCVLPWVLKNLVFYGNPVFPYLDDVFRPGAEYPVMWRALHQDAWARDWTRLLGDAGALKRAILHPWYLAMAGDTAMDYMGPFFLIGLPFFVLFRARDRSARVWFFVMIALWLLWWPLTRMPRFFIPGLCLALVWMARCAIELRPRPLKHVFAALVLVIMANCFTWAVASMNSLEGRRVLIDGESWSHYLRVQHVTYPTPYYAAAEWINQNTSPDSRVLIVGDARGYYLERPFVASSVFDTNFFEHWVRRSASAARLGKNLEEAGITHLLVNMAETRRLRKQPALQPEDVARLEEFFSRHTARRFEHSGSGAWCLVYEIVAGPRAGSTRVPPLIGWYRDRLGKRARLR